MLLRNDSQQSKKSKIYPYIGEVQLCAGQSRGCGWAFVQGVELSTNGLVYPVKSRRALKIPMGEWYAIVTLRDHDAAWLVRRTKLDDPRKIESLRWRVHDRLARARFENAALWTEAKTIGRVYTRALFSSERELMLYDNERDQWGAMPKSAVKGDVVSKIGLIPTPEEEAMGERLSDAGDQLMGWLHRALMMDEVLQLCFDLHGECVDLRSHVQRVFEVNGRRYYMSFVDGRDCHRRGRVWPQPSDHITDL